MQADEVAEVEAPEPDPAEVIAAKRQAWLEELDRREERLETLEADEPAHRYLKALARRVLWKDRGW
jgi:hypothetical protein